MPSEAVTTRGVSFTPPPADLLPSIKAAIDTAVATIPSGKRVAAVSVFNRNGANAAIVGRVGERWEVYSWIGKKWDADLDYGVAVRWSR